MNDVFALAASGRRLPHIALAVPLTGVFVLLSQLGALPVLLVLRPPGLSLAGLDAGALALFLVSASAPLFPLLWAWLRWFERRPFWTVGLPAGGVGRKYARGFALGVLAFALSLVGPAAAGWFALGGLRLAALGGALGVALGWLVQGAAEEVLMRGWLMGVVGARYRPWLGVLVSALVFAALHGLNNAISPLALLNLLLFGVFAALYTLWERGLWGVAAFHSAWNWAQGSVFGLPVSGLPLGDALLPARPAAGADWITGGAFGPEGGLAVTAVLLAGIGLLAWRLAARSRASRPVSS